MGRRLQQKQPKGYNADVAQRLKVDTLFWSGREISYILNCGMPNV